MRSSDAARSSEAEPGRLRHSPPSSAGRPRFFCSGNLGYRPHANHSRPHTDPASARCPHPRLPLRFRLLTCPSFTHTHTHTHMCNALHCTHTGTHSRLLHENRHTPRLASCIIIIIIIIHHFYQTRSACDYACLLARSFIHYLSAAVPVIPSCRKFKSAPAHMPVAQSHSTRFAQPAS